MHRQMYAIDRINEIIEEVEMGDWDDGKQIVRELEYCKERIEMGEDPDEVLRDAEGV